MLFLRAIECAALIVTFQIGYTVSISNDSVGVWVKFLRPLSVSTTVSDQSVECEKLFVSASKSC